MERFVRYSASKRVREDLPPPEVWAHDPRTQIQTPLDERGLVDFPALVTAVKGTVKPGYTWDSPFNDRHHLQWPRRFYPDSDGAPGPNPSEFRHLGINMVRVPRYFHNWTHLITEPPPPPTAEVMWYRIDAQRVALNLFEQVREVNYEGRLQLLSGAALKNYLLDHLEQRFDDFAGQVELAKQQPEEFQVIQYERYPLRAASDMVVIARTIARDALYRSAIRDVRRPIAA